MPKVHGLLDYPLEILQRYVRNNPDISDKHRESGLKTFARLKQRNTTDVYQDSEQPMDGYSRPSVIPFRRDFGIAQSLVNDPSKKHEFVNVMVHELIHTAYDGLSEGATDIHRIRAIQHENRQQGAAPIRIVKSSYTPLLFKGNLDVEANKTTGGHNKLKMFEPRLPIEELIYEIMQNRNNLPITPAMESLYLKAVNCHDIDGILREFKSGKMSSMTPSIRKDMAEKIIGRFHKTTEGLEFYEAENGNMARTLMRREMFDRQTERSSAALMEIAGMSKDKMTETMRENRREFKNLSKTWSHIKQGKISVTDEEENAVRPTSTSESIKS